MLEGQGACRAGGQAARGSRLRERESDEEAAPREEAADAHGECRAEGRPRERASSERDVPGRESRGQTVNRAASDAKERATRVGGGGMPREPGRECAGDVTKGSDGAVREEQETRRERAARGTISARERATRAGGRAGDGGSSPCEGDTGRAWGVPRLGQARGDGPHE